MCVYIYVCVCVCVCCPKGRKKEQERGRERERENTIVCVCVSGSVCVRERETHTHTGNTCLFWIICLTNINIIDIKSKNKISTSINQTSNGKHIISLIINNWCVDSSRSCSSRRCRRCRTINISNIRIMIHKRDNHNCPIGIPGNGFNRVRKKQRK